MTPITVQLARSAAQAPRLSLSYRFTKRFLDIVFSVTALAVFLIPMLITALAIRLTSKSGVRKTVRAPGLVAAESKDFVANVLTVVRVFRSHGVRH